MEVIDISCNSKPVQAERSPCLCGVVGSGNLEVLIKKGTTSDQCQVRVNTSTRGFGDIWHAVVEQFAEENAVGGTQIYINDMGATPAVVTLRLSQGLAMYLGEAS